MPRHCIARSDQVDVIYRESHALWGAGLSFEDYRGFWTDLNRTTWADRHLTYRVWVDDDDSILSSLKLYQPTLRLSDRIGLAAGIGAVFTPRAQRGRGHASAMLRSVLDESRARGDLAALLFSDVGTRFYELLGFRRLPAEEAWGEIGRRGALAPSGWTLRPMKPSDIEAVRDVHERSSRRRSLAVIRDLDYWSYLLERSRSFFARLDGSDLSSRFQVANHGGEFAGYLATVDSGDVWIIREAEAVRDDPEDLAAILRSGAAQARSRGRRRVYAWFPRTTGAAVPEWRLRFRPRQRAIPMMRVFDAGLEPVAFDSHETAFIPYLDQF